MSREKIISLLTDVKTNDIIDAKKERNTMFIDVAKIYIKAGDGGHGAVSFHREKYVANGGPDGGDGGRGGNIIFVADRNLNTLMDFRYKRKFIAQNGENGRGKRCNGKSAEDLVIKVPFGTVITESESGRVLADISSEEPVMLLKGGRGGFGNSHFATPTRQIPRFAKSGTPGEDMEVQLELKLIADVGLIGFPNVGKSTFISCVSAAKPKIANYHFTTLSPVLGVVGANSQESFVMADIPGLIEGAAEGVGLGHDFLRHVERCRLLVHVVDVSGSEGRNPIDDFNLINNELFAYDSEMKNVPQIVVANKCDIATEEQYSEFESYIKSQGYPIFKASAATRSGLDDIINAVKIKLKDLPPVKKYEVEAAPIEEILDKNSREFTVTVEDSVYFVEAKWLIPILNSVNMDDYESLQYFQRVLRTSGIIDKLLEMGIQEEDTVSIYDFEFDFVN